MSTLTVRKNFTMLDEISKKLEFLSKIMHKKQSQVIQELILKETRKYEKEDKLKRLEAMHGKLDGLLDTVSIQSIKTQNA
ncbi:MAG: hypothetical protein Q9M40_09900 [Sulfurimonas sp.]|nr:hypothetical protein [Sulfurimonas sp.]